MKEIKELGQDFKPGDMVAFAKGSQGSEFIYIGSIIRELTDNIYAIKSDTGREIQRHKYNLLNLEIFREFKPELFI